ncbi:hypothetical protein B566_EDAN011999 [Ephemera danica]|nr:hypothetical protein B566_EDAN011999 [Ephemera danica]
MAKEKKASVMQRFSSVRSTRRVPPLHWLQSRYRCSSVQVASQTDAPVSAEWANARPYSEIPGPRPLPLIGNAWRFLPVIGTIPTADFLQWSKYMQTTFGPISKVSGIAGRNDLVFLTDPKDFETVLRHEGPWPELLLMDSMAYYRNVTRKDFFQGEGGILVENGESWQRFRSYVNPVMMQPRNVRKYNTCIDEIAQEFVNKIPAMLNQNGETSFNFIKELQKWALESISMIALDTRLGCLETNLDPESEPYRLINASMDVFDLLFHLDAKFQLWKYVTTPTWRRFVQANDVFVEVSMRHIEKAQRGLKVKQEQDETKISVLEKLLLRDPNPRKAAVMAIDMMISGIDTTSFTAGCVLYHLARNPEQQERLFSELKEAMPSPDSPLTADILEDLKYLKACIKENNRNYTVPKGTGVVMCNLLATTNEEQFSRASQFIPERWLKDSKGQCPVQKGHKPHPFAMLPFGHGKRNCVGMRFALLEIETLVARRILYVSV